MNKEAEIKRYVEELKVGNQANFKHLYTMTFAGASAVAARYLKNRDDQMDVIQEAHQSSGKNQYPGKGGERRIMAQPDRSHQIIKYAESQ